MRLALALALLVALPVAAHEHDAHDHAAMHAQAAVEVPAAGHDHAAHAEHADHGKHEAALVAKPVAMTAEGAVYGAVLPASLPAILSLDAVVADPAPHLGKPGAFSGRITEVCQMQGCWMVLAAENGDFARVLMHDHAFGVPKDSGGGSAVVYGTLAEKILSDEEAAHLKGDGASAKAGRELQIDATSVLIRSAG